MRGRETKGPPSADLLVCFPSRSHLTLMPKPICSPARPPDPNKRHHNHNHHHHHHHHQQPHHHHLRKLSNKGGGGGGGGGGYPSPLLWSKPKPMGPDISEPTSPKVTCAGQIKVRPKASCKNWQSVMEEIEKLHNDRKQKQKSSWAEALGFKKDTMQFLSCLRRIRFDFRCFGSFPSTDLTSDDEEDEEEDDEVNRVKQVVGVDESDGNENSATVFSNWFMVLQEEKNSRFTKEQSEKQSEQRKQSEEYSHEEEPMVESCGPPPNALLLMRCRSAPAKSWLEERAEENDEDEEGEKEEEEKNENLETEEKKKRSSSSSLAVLMKSDTDFYNLPSSEIAKETWVVGGFKDTLARSRSWKR